MWTLPEIIAAAFLSLGTLFLTLGSIGIVRLPDFFTRLHAASMSDTLGIIFFTAGLAVYLGFTLDILKLAVLFILISLTNPTASHALSRAALKGGLRPWNVKRSKKGGKP